ncbi:MAG: hypothetical protein VW268_01660 [Rhodospirillaceae bacterium]
MHEIVDGGLSVEHLTDPDFRQALAYWDVLRGNRVEPSWGEVELMDLPPRLVPYLTAAEMLTG